jgi:N-acetylglucosaminyldiphosphoundecaprenol N-acetyl-beta-D-mannosaminyltransferase
MIQQNIMGFNIYNSSLESIVMNPVSRPLILNTISPNSYGLSTKDLAFKQALLESDILVLDGVYFALASILLTGKNIKKNQGPEVFNHFMSRLNGSGGKVFFLGSTEHTLEKIKTKALSEYPNLIIDTYSPPYKEYFSDNDNNIIINKINNFSPDILFIGMTCPKQEKWANKNKLYINVNIICSVGAVFDWYAGNEKEIHPIWWKLRLGWLIRTINRPEILKRYPNIGIFFIDLFLTIIRLKKF